MKQGLVIHWWCFAFSISDQCNRLWQSAQHVSSQIFKKKRHCRNYRKSSIENLKLASFGLQIWMLQKIWNWNSFENSPHIYAGIPPSIWFAWAVIKTKYPHENYSSNNTSWDLIDVNLSIAYANDISMRNCS